MLKTDDHSISINEKKQRILEMIEKYGDEEDKKLDREKILSSDENVEKIHTFFSTKEKSDRDSLLERYQTEAIENYMKQKKILDELLEEMKKLILKFEDMRQKSYDEKEADDLLINIE